MGITVNGLAELARLSGADLGVSDWVTVSQDRVGRFADATDDHQWIHVDVDRAARESPFGGPVAHGYLTLSLCAPLMGQLLTVDGVTAKINYGLNRVRFPAPVPSGARIRLAGRIAEVAEVTGGLQVTVDGTMEVEGNAKPACVLQSVTRYYG
ncbi:MaoC family dehydratase [Streptomyces sp. 4N509B]|uniref:MaoC family dehydratase n=1 Tax=Streptomyces sp. 4N509B TaxID=3457413 RepID=UPI003FD4ACF5